MNELSEPDRARRFCESFLSADPRDRIVFGINQYATTLAEHIDVGGFVDDFTSETRYMGKPIMKTEEVPKRALVVSSLLIRPWTAHHRLAGAGLEHLDFFAFYEYSGIDLPRLRFWGGFRDEYQQNGRHYEWLGSRLADEASRRIYNKLIAFRLSGLLSHMSGFTDRQKEQYFEGFLAFREQGEVFVDVGSFDGCTSLQFAGHCPHYRSIFVLEPDAENMRVAKANLADCRDVRFVQKGASNARAEVAFSMAGSSSTISDSGKARIEVDALDNVLTEAPTLIKMDIEGAEALAIEGAQQTILDHHPRLAICVYHKMDDLWRIPQQVLAIRDDYDIYLRHYTEGVTETVMFFIPRRRID